MRLPEEDGGRRRTQAGTWAEGGGRRWVMYLHLSQPGDRPFKSELFVLASEERALRRRLERPVLTCNGEPGCLEVGHRLLRPIDRLGLELHRLGEREHLVLPPEAVGVLASKQQL